LYLLILRTLARDRCTATRFAKRIKEHPAETLQIEDGSLYPALNRMLVDGERARLI